MQNIIRLFICLTCLLTATTGVTGFIDSDPYSGDRALFLKASKALDENRPGDYKQLAAQLEDYPLYPYLQFQELRKRLKKAAPDEITAFMEHHDGDPLGWEWKL